MQTKFTGYVVKEGTSFYSICIELDIASQGDTQIEAKNNLLEAVELYFDTSVDYNLPIYRPVPDEDNPAMNNKENIVDKFNFKINLEMMDYA